MKQNKVSDSIPEGRSSRTLVGIALSVVYLILLAALITIRWESVKGLELNALGDFFAGAFGPLAILWLVLGYFQQGDELKQNTTALKLQADELAESVRQQEQLVAITREQFEEAKREARRESARLEAAARPKFESQLFDKTEESDGPVLRVKLTNVGAPCSHFRAISVSPGVHAVVDHPDDGTQTRLVRVSLPEQNRPETVEFLVSYLDSAGRPGSQTFTVTYYADEDFWGYVVSGEDDGRVWQHATSSAAEVRGV